MPGAAVILEQPSHAPEKVVTRVRSETAGAASMLVQPNQVAASVVLVTKVLTSGKIVAAVQSRQAATSVVTRVRFETAGKATALLQLLQVLLSDVVLVTLPRLFSTPPGRAVQNQPKTTAHDATRRRPTKQTPPSRLTTSNCAAPGGRFGAAWQTEVWGRGENRPRGDWAFRGRSGTGAGEVGQVLGDAFQGGPN